MYDGLMNRGKESHRWEEISPLHLVQGVFKHLLPSFVSLMSPPLSR